MLSPNVTPDIYEVSQLVSEAGLLLGQHFSIIWVTGEISNLSFPKSGHLYFSLKDEKSQIRCALFNHYYQKSNLNLKEGMQVLLRATVSIYQARGDFQLIVQHIELAGEGKLRQAFEWLKRKLQQEGIFDPIHKKLLPKFPQKIGIITSDSGAAIRDVLVVLKRRFAAIPIIIYPTLVQGQRAASQISEAIKLANERQEVTVLLLCRGGGSIEDLWAFNEESVAKAIFNSQLPVITGIGHEVDFTIADFVADVRAPTPSGAAELLVQDVQTVLGGIWQSYDRMNQAMCSQLRQTHQNLLHLKKRLQHPKDRLETQSEKLHGLKQRLFKAMQYQLFTQQTIFKQAHKKWEQSSPLNQISLLKQECFTLQKRLIQQTQHQLAMKTQKLSGLNQALASISPLNTLNRGYAIALKAGQILTDPAATSPGDEIQIKLAKGVLTCVVAQGDD